MKEVKNGVNKIILNMNLGSQTGKILDDIAVLGKQFG